ncbi:MAG: L-erythro-3,5-diaminohexanoate dehydrogenase [Deltaproteobacteria bacterium]|nr:L-erythro-3,5-diaminohexanoate dehydrogenase [Deltaproteobacteria bacterium]
MNREGNFYGLHRVMDERPCLPQVAKCLDPRLPIYSNEILIQVEKINVDSASFRQMKELCGEDPHKLKEHILTLVKYKGKLHNPVTESGGMLAGKVLEVGAGYRGPLQLSKGDFIATLVSLTLTPLVLENIHSINLHTGQLQVQGYAILFESGIAAKIPEDFSANLAVALFDVCGAPQLVHRHVQAQDKVLVMGAGKSGLLSAFAALDKVGKSASVVLADASSRQVQVARDLGFGAVEALADQPVDFLTRLPTRGGFNVVVNTTNKSDTEMAAILACKPRGKVLFFNMATQFGRAVLGAEGVGADVDLLMGNGYSQGHAEYVLDLVRRNKELRKYFEGIYAGEEKRS